jgi:hypothetical protein
LKRAVAAALAAMLLLTGCSSISGDVSDLMTPPKLTAEQQAIEKALDGYVGYGKYTLQYPREGDYRSAFILHNLDTDSEQEAVALYTLGSESAGTHIMVLKKSGGKWQKQSEISSSGSEVDKIDFGDYYGEGHDQFAVAWTELSSTNLGVSIYDAAGNRHAIKGTFTQMKTVDLDGDGKSDLLMLRLDRTARTAAATLYACRDGAMVPVSSAKLDSTVSSYANIYATKVDGTNAVFIDGYKGQHGMVTEILMWSGGKMYSPSLDSATDTVKPEFTRRVTVPCRDIDGNGSLEIPEATELPGYTDISDYDKKLWLVSWQPFSAGTLGKSVRTCVINSSESYYFICPDKWNGSVTVDNSLGNNIWSFRLWDGGKMTDTLFTISTFTGSDWENSKNISSPNVYELQENNGIVYVVSVNPKLSADAHYLDLAGIRQNFRIYT